MRSDLTTPLVTDALDMAISQRKPNGVIFHSDRGSQYSSTAFGNRCQETGIVPSMGRRGDAYDNAVAESFFATLETELLNRNTYHTRTQARTAVFDFIEGFYNPHPTALHPRVPITHQLRKEPPKHPLNPQTENRPQKRGNSKTPTQQATCSNKSRFDLPILAACTNALRLT